MIENKTIVFNNIKAEAKGRVRSGICAVFNNVDSWGDRIHAGAFSKTIKENLSRVKFLWNHGSYGSSGFTTAKILELVEVSREDLPAEVLAKAPEATGGLKVVRKYYDDDDGNKILTRIDAGDINEMSFAFEVMKSSETEEETGFDDMPKRRIRELHEMKLFDCSDVNWGMNLATVAAGAKGFNLPPLGLLYQQFSMHLEQVKAGSRNSASDMALINQMHQIAVDLGAKCATDEDDEKSAKSQTNEPEEKEAEAAISTSLNPEWFEMQKRKLANLEF